MKVKLHVMAVYGLDLQRAEEPEVEGYVRVVEYSDLAPLLRLWEAMKNLDDNPYWSFHATPPEWKDVQLALAAVPVEEEGE